MATKPKRMYFDYAASTPVAPEVIRAMEPYFSERFGNPGSLHAFGQEAMAAVDRSREVVAGAIGAGFREMVFTGSATEANNIALRAAVRMAGAAPRILVSAIEHESVLETARDLAKEGAEIVEIPVDRQGIVKLRALDEALDERAAIVSIMYANNETGAVQPFAKIAKMMRDVRSRKTSGASGARTLGPLLHVDAVQAFQFLDCNVDALGADLLTVSAHKIYGPKGAGALYIRSLDARRPHALITGGGQEFGVRSGTENVPLIAGFAAAVTALGKGKAEHTRRIAGLRKEFMNGVARIFPKAALNGSADGLPHIANVWFPGKPAEELLIRLDRAGVAASAGSACAARSARPSHVLGAMGLGEARARESVRFSFGRPTTPVEIRSLLAILKKVLA